MCFNFSRLAAIIDLKTHYFSLSVFYFNRSNNVCSPFLTFDTSLYILIEERSVCILSSLPIYYFYEIMFVQKSARFLRYSTNKFSIFFLSRILFIRFSLFHFFETTQSKAGFDSKILSINSIENQPSKPLIPLSLKKLD